MRFLSKVAAIDLTPRSPLYTCLVYFENILFSQDVYRKGWNLPIFDVSPIYKNQTDFVSSCNMIFQYDNWSNRVKMKNFELRLLSKPLQVKSLDWFIGNEAQKYIQSVLEMYPVIQIIQCSLIPQINFILSGGGFHFSRSRCNRK